MAITKLVADSLGAGATPNQSAFKNIIINGDMSIAQRGDVTGANSSGYKAIDRYRHTISIATWSISQSTDVPSGQGFAKSMKMDCTTAEASPGSTDALAFVQKIEGQNLQYLKKGTSSAESLTVSFWVKSNKTGTAQVNLFDEDNTRIIGKQWSISSADTWEKKTLTFDGDTSGALGNDNGSSLRCEIWLDAGSAYKTGATPTSWESLNTADYFAGGTLNLGDNTANEIYITGLQMEVGTTASDFEFLPHDVNLERCQRYFETNMSYGVTPANPVSDADANIYGSAGAFASSACRLDHFFLTRKRTSPSMTFYNVNNLSGSVDAGKWQIYDGGWSQSTSATATGAANQNMVNIQINDTFTVGNIYLVAGGLTADAEL